MLETYATQILWILLEDCTTILLTLQVSRHPAIYLAD